MKPCVYCIAGCMDWQAWGKNESNDIIAYIHVIYKKNQNGVLFYHLHSTVILLHCQCSHVAAAVPPEPEGSEALFWTALQDPCGCSGILGRSAFSPKQNHENQLVSVNFPTKCFQQRKYICGSSVELTDGTSFPSSSLLFNRSLRDSLSNSVSHWLIDSINTSSISGPSTVSAPGMCNNRSTDNIWKTK